MTKDVVTIQGNDPIKKAVALLAENRFRALPVVDEDKKIIGIITTHDIIDMVNDII